jgi:hypothetical protein
MQKLGFKRFQAIAKDFSKIPVPSLDSLNHKKSSSRNEPSEV